MNIPAVNLCIKSIVSRTHIRICSTGFEFGFMSSWGHNLMLHFSERSGDGTVYHKRLLPSAKCGSLQNIMGEVSAMEHGWAVWAHPIKMHRTSNLSCFFVFCFYSGLHANISSSSNLTHIWSSCIMLLPVDYKQTETKCTKF